MLMMNEVTHLGFPTISFALALQRLFVGNLDDLLLYHETFEVVKSLLKGDELASGQSFVKQTPFEFAVVECRAIQLLFNAQILQNALNNVEIQGDAALHGTDGHELHHLAGVEVRLVDAELFHNNVWQMRINSLQNVSKYDCSVKLCWAFATYLDISDIGRGTKNPHRDVLG